MNTATRTFRLPDFTESDLDAIRSAVWSARAAICNSTATDREHRAELKGRDRQLTRILRMISNAEDRGA